MNFGNVAMLASIVASLVTVPAASATITGDVTAAGTQLLEAPEEDVSDVPRTITETLGADRMEKRLETAFGTASFVSEGDRFRSRLETPAYSVETVKTPELKKQVYSSASVDLRIERRAGHITSTCTTAHGTLTTETDSGTTRTSFTGTDREQVRERCDRARTELRDGADRLARIAMQLDMIQRQVEITSLNRDTESITVRNSGPVTVSLANWTLQDEDDNRFRFDTELRPGESVTLYSGGRVRDDECEPSGSVRCWSGSYVWDNSGETAVLLDGDGNVAAELSYGEQ